MSTTEPSPRPPPLLAQPLGCEALSEEERRREETRLDERRRGGDETRGGEETRREEERRRRDERMGGARCHGSMRAA